MPNIKLRLSGLTCGSCIRNVTNILKANDHVIKVLHVDLSSAEIEVDVTSQSILNSIFVDVSDIGYTASLA